MSFRTRFEKIRSTNPSVFDPEPWLEYPALIEEMLLNIEKYETENISSREELRKKCEKFVLTDKDLENLTDDEKILLGLN